MWMLQKCKQMAYLELMILAEILLMAMTHFLGKVKQGILPHYYINRTTHALLETFGQFKRSTSLLT